MKKQLTFLMIGMPAHGHMNPCIGIGDQLRERGHRIHFILFDKQWQGKLTSHGFVEEFVDLPASAEASDLSDFIFKNMIENGWIRKASPLEKNKMLFQMTNWYLHAKPLDPHVEQILNRVKPDSVIVDIYLTPSIIKSGLPWINVMPAHPLYFLDDERTPPGGSGLPTYDKTGWEEFRTEINKVFDKYIKEAQDWFSEEGCFPPQGKRFLESSYLNIYDYPEELDYLDLRPLPENWMRFDSFIRLKEEEFEVPDQLKDKPGKLIFFSMGSMGSADVGLMKRLTGFLAKSPHRFIVSKGALGDTYELPDNCWGQKSVAQTRVLPLVDLAVVHGGNNTVCEAFYFGTPLVVMPLFTDQFDNAQRIVEKQLGVRLNPFACNERDLFDAIETVANNDQLKLKMQAISKRIKMSVESGRLVDTIENLAKRCSPTN